MKRLQIPDTRVQTQYTKFGGGIDLTTPVMSLRPGCALDAMNYEPGLNGGYKRIDGFERVDGRLAPSSASYDYLQTAGLGSIAVGQTITGSPSGATGIVIAIDTAYQAVCVTKVTGAFQRQDQLQIGGVTQATLIAPPSPRGQREAYSDAMTLAAAADLYRADIQPVPGSGPLRGVWMHLGVLYAFRNNTGGTACAMYKATSTGWALVPLGEEIVIENATSVTEGATLTQGSVTATIKRVVIQTGALGAANTGRLILSARAGGNFAAGAATSTGGGTVTLKAAQTAITLLPGGRFEFVSSNFYGSTSTRRMYGCDGVNRAFEFDGTTFVPIVTGMALDAPKFITVHKLKLFLAFKGSVQHSGDGTPYQWTVLSGANEIGLGDDVTGMAPQAGDTLALFTRNSSHQLNGATSNSFQLLPISSEVGALLYTVQTVGKTLALDDRGVISTDRTQAYGNFAQAAISAAVQPLVERLRTRVVGSSVYRSRSQYRIYGADGSGLIVGFGEGGLLGITQLQYPVKPTCLASCENAAGQDVVYFGADNGFVYQADVGSSFDGVPIEAYLRMPFNNLSSPRHRKRFRKAVMEMSAVAYASVRFQPEFSGGDPDVGTHRLQTAEITGAGGHWDVDNWDEFFYDARLVSSPEFSIEGTGLSMSLLFYSSTALDLGHVMQGMLVHFSIRKLSR
jgi:hypothetical protein